MTVTNHGLLGGILGTDQYQLTMAQLYWKEGLAERQAQFDYFFRSYPDYGTHKAGYCVAAGLGWLLEWMEGVRFRDEELQALRSQRTANGDRRFDDGFLDWLAEQGDFSSIELRAVPEGRVVHANAPVVMARGPIGMAQILETPLLNRLNYPTLVATKASRVKEAARGGLVMEFGLRRGPESGADAGARAALIGGCDFSSNVAASHAVGLDPKGTHAHSMIQAFMALDLGEEEAFRRYAALYPDEAILLVDTIDTIESGIPNAIKVFQELKSEGHQPVGIRIDSGDLAYLSVQAARMLNDAGLDEVSVVISSDLDELAIWSVLSQVEDEAPRYGLDPQAVVDRMTFGVGTRLITSSGDSALGGVYKLVAIDDLAGSWEPAIKVSEDLEKIPIPGEKQLFRVYDQRGLASADVVALSDEDLDVEKSLELFHPHRDVHRIMSDSEISRVESVLETVFKDGSRQDGEPDMETMRERRTSDLERLDTGVRRLVNPHIYHVSLTSKMKQLQLDLVADATDGNSPFS